MHKATFDPGLTQQYTGTLRRAINKDGSFNVKRRGATWRDIHPYMHMLNMTWPQFFGLVFAGYLGVNTVFALIYYQLGPDQLQGAYAPNAFSHFLNSFFFSAHTLTTVGYGNIAPKGAASNFVAAFEALVGLMGFAIATGIFYGRVSRPSARIGFSPNLLITPYQDGTAVEFRIVNLRRNNLMELEASVMFMAVDGPPGSLKRSFDVLSLERKNVFFFPLTWTIVHPIDRESPFYGKTAQDLERAQAELLILIKGYDDTFSQTVHARYSYRYDEIVWGGRFSPAFRIDQAGDMVLNVDQVGALQLERG